MTGSGEDLRNRIENVAELSSICRGEWCRSLESRVDFLEEEVESLHSGGANITGAELTGMHERLREAYRHVGPIFMSDVHQ